MRLLTLIIILFFCNALVSCSHKPAPVPLTLQQAIELKVDSLKQMAEPGDLITRLNDDIVSEMVKELAEHDKSFSHSGIIFLKGSKKMVCHIYPANYPADTVLFEPLDSFINPQKNLSAGLFRYNFTPVEKTAFLAKLQSYHDNNIHFDKIYDLKTDSVLYCSEMIAKALLFATNNRIACKTIVMPKKILPFALTYFKEYHPTYDYIKNLPFIPIENLYNMAACKQIIRTPLKYMP